jgi:predicted phosphodiesterase
MKLQILSDLHLEMHADGGSGLIRELDPAGVDVLVLAGDITMARRYADLERVFKPLAKKYRHILYVPGNHEYYKSSPREVARNRWARTGRHIVRQLRAEARVVYRSEPCSSCATK